MENWPITEHPTLFFGAMYIGNTIIGTNATTWECEKCKFKSNWNEWEFSSILENLKTICPKCGEIYKKQVKKE